MANIGDVALGSRFYWRMWLYASAGFHGNCIGAMLAEGLGDTARWSSVSPVNNNADLSPAEPRLISATTISVQQYLAERATVIV